jgi:hypothetical protein
VYCVLCMLLFIGCGLLVIGCMCGWVGVSGRWTLFLCFVCGVIPYLFGGYIWRGVCVQVGCVYRMCSR